MNTLSLGLSLSLCSFYEFRSRKGLVVKVNALLFPFLLTWCTDLLLGYLSSASALQFS